MINLPFIGHPDSYTAIFTYCVIILAVWKKQIRTVALAVLGAYCAFRILVPLSQWAYALFKFVAWAGFYVHFFLVAIGYATRGIELLRDLEGKLQFLAGETDR